MTTTKIKDLLFERCATITQLLELAKWVREAKNHGQELGLDGEGVAFYDALAENGTRPKNCVEKPTAWTPRANDPIVTPVDNFQGSCCRPLDAAPRRWTRPKAGANGRDRTMPEYVATAVVTLDPAVRSNHHATE